MTNSMQESAEKTRLGIPLFISANHEGGAWAKLQLYSTTGPGNMAIGATGDKEDAYQMGHIMGTELNAVGINVNFAPVYDVNCNPDNPIIGVRSFGESPDLVSMMGTSMTKGMQDAGIAACAKHFPGHGDTSIDSHTGLPIVPHNKSRLYSVELAPFQEAVDEGVDMIMTAHIIYPAFDDSGKPATLSRPILTDLLKNEMGFEGVVITDAMAMGAITKNYGSNEACVMAIQAGADIILDTINIEDRINAVKDAVRNGKISMERIDDAVSRILTLKQKLGLWDNRYVDPAKAEKIVGCAEHKEIERRVAGDSITLVKNEGIVPLRLDGNDLLVIEIIDIGGAINTLGENEGKLSKEVKDHNPNTQNIFVTQNTCDLEIKIARKLAKNAEVVIIGTQNFPAPAFHPGYEGQVKLINALLNDGNKVVVIGMRDPYDLRFFPDVNGYIATYTIRKESVSEAVNVLFGESEANGLLPVTIPDVIPYYYGYPDNRCMVKGRILDDLGKPIAGAAITMGNETSHMI